MTIVILILAVCTNLFAQPYYFKHYQVEQGLSNNTIFCSLQGKNGFMWFGTKEGLNRFDGYHFKLLTLGPPSQPQALNNFIYSLYADPTGRIWVGAQRGLYYYDEMKEALICVNDRLKDISNMTMDGNGHLWFLSRTKVYYYNSKSERVAQAPHTDHLFTTALSRSDDDQIWLADIDGFLYQYNRQPTMERYSMFNHSKQAPTKWINKLVPDSNGAIFVCTSGQGLKRFYTKDGHYEDVINYNLDGTTMYARDVLKNKYDEYWIATESGIYIHNPSSNEFTNLRKKFQDPYSISDNAVYNLCKDREGGIWAGTFFGGINYFPQQFQPFQKYYPDLSGTNISGNAVREITADDDGFLWITTEDAGLNKLNPATGTVQHFNPTGKAGDVSYSNIHGVLADGNDIWVGTFEHGLDVINRKNGRVYRHYDAGPSDNQLKSNFVLTILKHQNGNIYCGTSNGVFRYRQESDDFEQIKGLPNLLFAAALEEDSKGIIWIGTHGAGLFYTDPTTHATKKLPLLEGDQQRHDNLFINALLNDSRQQLWIATEGRGLVHLDENHNLVKIFTKADGLPSNYIFKVLEDNLGHIWISTSRGLARMHHQTGEITVYRQANGLLNDQFNYNSGFKDKYGKLYFGSIKGMISFQPEAFRRDTLMPSLFITGFQVNNKELLIDSVTSPLKKSILFTDKIRLNHHESSFSIDFAAVSFTSPEVTRYQYKMDGLDDQWTTVENNRKVYFTNLSPGNYQFRVQALNSTNRPTAEKVLQVIIEPPMWATWWAYLLYAFVIISLIWWLTISYHNRTQLKKEREIYQAKIDFFTNVAHEIKTPLTLIKGPVENLQERISEIPSIEKDISMLDRNTTRLINLVQQILDFRQTETKAFELEWTNVNLSKLIRQVFEDFKPIVNKKKLKYTISNLEKEFYVKADEEALEKIISNLLSNAIKYGDTEVSVELNINHSLGRWWLLIHNDGQLIPEELRTAIFEPFFRIKELGKQKGTGIGLALSQSLAQLHNGKIICTSIAGNNTFILQVPIHTSINTA